MTFFLGSDCDEIQCYPHAECLPVGHNLMKCKCKTGYYGNGETCRQLDTDDCFSSPNICDLNANCLLTPNGSRCICKFGFVGNGQFCFESEKICKTSSNCGENSECVLNVFTGLQFCVCAQGYIGDGYLCISKGNA